MGEPAELTGRVTRLEHEMAEVRFLATKAEKEVSDCTAVLHGHTGVLNAIREDQVDQGRKLAKLDARLGKVESQVRVGFAEMHDGFARVDAEMHGGFARVDQRFADVNEGFARVDAEMHGGFARVDQQFAEVNEGFARVDAEARRNYSMLAQGQERITELLTRHIRQCEPGKEG